jgi:Zn-dependent protease
MFSIFSNVGPEIPFALLLMALLGLKARVVPRASLWIGASADKVWELVELKDGKRENWGRTQTFSECVDAFRQVYRKTYQTQLTNGVARAFEAYFSIKSQVPEQELVIVREGLEGKSTNNELLQQNYHLAPENGGTRLTMSYEWGQRSILAQLTARADLWGGAYRLKGLAETGIANERPYHIISLLVSLVTGLLTLAGFALLFKNWYYAMFIIFVLFIHEFGHLLAYRMIGQPWGRMIFLPFLGAIAMPRLPFESQGQTVFAALMGPGISVLLLITCLLGTFTSTAVHNLSVILGIVTVWLNVFNLLPVEPLDGGIALRSVLSRLFAKHARFGLMATGALIAGAGFLFDLLPVAIFGGIAILANIKDRTIDAGLKPLSTLQLAISLTGYFAMVSAYITMMKVFYGMTLQV